MHALARGLEVLATQNPQEHHIAIVPEMSPHVLLRGVCIIEIISIR